MVYTFILPQLYYNYNVILEILIFIPIVAPYIYDARYVPCPSCIIILSTTVLRDIWDLLIEYL